MGISFQPESVTDMLVSGDCKDPFSTLGMQQTPHGLEVRVFLPEATQVEVICKRQGRKVAELSMLDPRGFFAGVIPHRKNYFAYQLLVSWGDYQEYIDDPYRFRDLLLPLDNWLLTESKYLRPYEQLGAHPLTLDGVDGVRFTVWAPHARRVSVIGDFNFWDSRRHLMQFRYESGIWELFIPGAKPGQLYKYEVINCNRQATVKFDPYVFGAEIRPNTASRITGLPDNVAITPARQQANRFSAPVTIYEVHLGSWRRHADNTWLSYRELGEELIPYVKEMGFTHIEVLPIMEHPFDGSWGYQPLGLYAPTSRFGSPQDFRDFVHTAHEAGINIILDWVPGHFPDDAYGLSHFDGTALYEYADPREGRHLDWNTCVYNYNCYQVCNYLIGNALYWLERFGVDGLRFDAVTSMIYRDYSRKAGEWIANAYGGKENLEAIAFLKQTNRIIGQHCPGLVTIAEESTDYAGVTLPPENGGLGFHYKWNMGWMNDTLRYMQTGPMSRKHRHDLITFSILYAYSENFILPLSHDEVVYGKGSLLQKMPGDEWQKFANLRAYYGFMWASPGKKLLFMGGEFAQRNEWNHDTGLDWFLLHPKQHNPHEYTRRLVKALNHCYCHYSPLHELDCHPDGFSWLVVDDRENAIFVFERKDSKNNCIIVISNFTPQVHYQYRFGINEPGHYQEILNTDSHYYGGSNVGNQGSVHSETANNHGKPYSLMVTVPPLATIYLLKAGEQS